MADYTLNQLPHRETYRVDRQAQMLAPVALHFRPPAEYPPRRRRMSLLPWRRPPPPGLLNAMCDGEFVEIFRPRDVIISRKVTLKAIGRSPEASRIVLDTIKNDGLDAVHMDATALSAARGGGGAEPPQPAVANYVAAPFQRIFRPDTNATSNSHPHDIARDNILASNEPPHTPSLPPHILTSFPSGGSGRRSIRDSLRETFGESLLLRKKVTGPESASDNPATANHVHSTSLDLGRDQTL
ncbi:hypothetical protein IWW38_006480 [Coemansia aciculifera]|uniref:Uncharacterized protein n=1 Tax=Coemansia aciculifera TaxID=417176 RepID=A0ACC1LSM6_9FUNG|nr:hypothetical protein IWW38_006480 [Coemansia aciculifera]